MRCENCGFASPEGKKFCEQCGTQLVRVCPSCGVEVRSSAKFCGDCGAPLTARQEGETAKGRKGEPEVVSSQLSVVSSQPLPPNPQPPAGERRQLTVMFIDLVGSTTLSQQLDPEDYHARVVAYQTACHEVISRYAGHVAQYLGDGVLVYFGYPAAHEDDAVRAVRSGLEIITAVRQLEFTPRLQVRIGIHTGPVVVGEIGAGEHTEKLALGETPNIAARVQGTANPDEVMISAATSRLVEGLFVCEDRGQPALKGVATPLTLYCVVNESAVHSRFEVAVQKGLTPLAGRDEELRVLQRRWTQAKDGMGNAVLLSGEPGIGKSRLLQTLTEQVVAEGATPIEFRCSPYHQHSAFYPIIEHLQRLLQFQRVEAPEEKLRKLEERLKSRDGSQTRPSHALQEAVPLFAALLSLPPPEGHPPITLSPQKQKQKTQEVLLAWLMEEAQYGAVYCAWEDLHWADASTLEFLTLLLEQLPSSRMFALLTFRPEFTPPWNPRSYLTQLTLNRLGRPQVEAMVNHVVEKTLRPSTLRQAQDSGRTESDLVDESLPVRAEPVEARTVLSSEIIQQIVNKTDGVPLFVEELTKTILESGSRGVGESRGAHTQSALHVGIPTTLQDALMARLDRLGAAKEIAQLGATIGREFNHELLQAVSPLDAKRIQGGLTQLVDAELLYQRGVPPQAMYLFKHALIQDTAYQSLLKSKRQQYHQQIAQVLEARFPETKATQSELLAHHYTEANLIEQAIPYWQHAGQNATQRSANVEAIAHLSKGLELLNTLPDTPERVQQELSLQIALGAPLMAAKGFGATEVGRVYARARELCLLTGDTTQLFPILRGLWEFYQLRAEHQTARELAEQLFELARCQSDPALRLLAHDVLADTLLMLGEFRGAHEHAEQGTALYDVHQHHSNAFLYGYDFGIHCLSYVGWALWFLGYPDQALKKVQAALGLAQDASHPFTLAIALHVVNIVHHLRREAQAVREHAEAEMALSTEQGFAFFLAGGSMHRGWALVNCSISF